MSRYSHPRWRRRHQAVLEFVAANPIAKREAVALATGYSLWQVSRIVNSPSFRSRLEQAFRYRLMEVARHRVGGSDDIAGNNGVGLK
jgi:hypothetical protein